MKSWPVSPFGIDEGLPSNQVHDIAQDRLGRLWLAGPAGLVCHDGSSLRAYDQRHGLACQGLRSVCVDADSTLWIGSDVGLEAIGLDAKPDAALDGMRWAHGLVAYMVASSECLWVGANGGLIRMLRNTRRVAQIESCFDIGQIVAMDGSLTRATAWAVNTRGDLIALEPEAVPQQLIPTPPNGEHRVTCVTHTPDNLLLLGTPAGMRVVDLSGKMIASVGASGGHAATAVAATRDEWWIAYGSEICVHEASATAPLIARLTVGSNINRLFVDKLENVWIGTDSSGLQKVSCLRSAIARVDVGGGRAVYSIRPDGRESLRIGGEGFCASLDLRNPDSPSQRAVVEVPGQTVWDSHIDADGTVWLATQDGIFTASPDGRRETIGADSPLLSGRARVLLEHDGWLWLGMLHGLVRMRDGLCEQVTATDGQPFGYVYSLKVDRAGRLWIATLGRGLWRLRGSTIEALHSEPLSPIGNTYAVSQGPEGDVIVLQDTRVIRLDAADNAQVIAHGFPVAGWSALWLEPELLLVGTSRGLRLLRLDEPRYSREVRAMFKGGDWEFTNTRTLATGADGRVYCGVNGGLFTVSLSELRRFEQAPEVWVHGVEWRGATPELKGGVHLLQPGKWSMKVSVYSAWFIDEAHVRYRYRLTGFEQDWSELQLTPEVSFNSLPAGEYELVAQAHSPLVGFGPVASLCRLKVEPESLAQRRLAPLHAAGTAFVSHVIWPARNMLMRRRHNVMEAEIAQRTESLRISNKQLHEARERLERLSRTDALTGIGNRRYFEDVLLLESKRASRLQTPLSLILVDIDWFKRINDSYGHERGDECLCQVAARISELVRATDCIARWGGEEFAVLLPNTDGEGASVFAERIRAAIAGLEPLHADSPLQAISVSCGVSWCAAGADVSQLVAQADQALYEAKRRGRNRVETWRPEGSESPAS